MNLTNSSNINNAYIDNNIDMFYAYLFGYTGTFFSICFSISPILLFIEANKHKNLSKIPILMLLFNILNSALWLNYGYIKNQYPIIVSNLLNFFINNIWIIWYININYNNQNIIIRNMLSFCTLGIYLASYILAKKYFDKFVYHSYEMNKALDEDFSKDNYDKFVLVSDIISILATIINTFSYIAPGQNIYLVYKTGNYNSIPILSCVIGLLCAICWVCYSFVDKTYVYEKHIDWPCFISNGLGAIILINQIAIWFYYRNKFKGNILLKNTLT